MNVNVFLYDVNCTELSGHLLVEIFWDNFPVKLLAYLTHELLHHKICATWRGNRPTFQVIKATRISELWTVYALLRYFNKLEFEFSTKVNQKLLQVSGFG